MSSRYDDSRGERYGERDRDGESRRRDRYDEDRRTGDDRSRKHDREDSKRERSRSRDRSHKKKRERSESRERSKKKDKKDRYVRSQKQFLAKAHSSLRDRDRSLSPHSKAKADKKAAKAAKKREEELRAAKQIAELNMYTAEDNPFHDANLTQQFQWHKKREKEKKSGITEDEAKRREQARRLEAKVCLCHDSCLPLSHVCLPVIGRT